MLLLSLINFEKLKRAVLHFAVVLVVLALQNLLFSQIRPLGVAAMFVPAVVVAIGLFEGGVWGGVFGVVTGILCGMRYSGCLVLFPVLFAIFGFFTGLLTQFFLNKRFFPYYVLCVCAFLLTAFCQMFRPLFITGAPFFAVLRTGLLQVVWSLPFPFLIYFPIKNIVRKQDKLTAPARKG